MLGRIFSVLGTPTEENWPGVTELEDYIEFEKVEPQEFKDLFTGLDPNLVDLLEK